ncbi:TRAP transporter small permease subunit [Roseovarius salis]|uniref:TRAP transporter small permease n=1 Tax=Roseovarius salis TaxID=3376063 RepID=UPI0037C596ED
MKRLCQLHDALTRATFWAATFAVLYLTLVTAGEVFGRYVLSAPSDWAPDTAAVAFGLITFLAVPHLTWKSGHASMDFVVSAVPSRVSVVMQRINYTIGLLVCAVCAWIGGAEAARQISSGVMIVSVTPIPKWAVFVPLVYGLGSSALYFARHLAASFGPGDPAGNQGGRSWSGT